jgi:hypothetical protein
MTADTEFVYARARLQARFGLRLREPDWRLVESAVDLPRYVQALRQTSLARWVERIDPGASVHAIERVLREEWRGCVREIARWQPPAWQPAIAWIEVLADLPILDHLLRGEAAPAWVRDDPRYAAWERPTLQDRIRAVSERRLAPFARRLPRGDDPVLVWVDEWRRLWPKSPPALVAALHELVRVVLEHRAAGGRLGGGSAAELRETLARKAVRLFRWHAESPAAACAWLMLVALDVERLRAGIVRRRLAAALAGGGAS